MYLNDTEKRRLIREYFKYRKALESLSWLEDESIFEYHNLNHVISEFIEESCRDLWQSIIQRRFPRKGIWLCIGFLTLVRLGYSLTRGIIEFFNTLLISNLIFLFVGIAIVIYLLPKLKLRKVIYKLYRDNLPRSQVTDEQIIEWLNEDIYNLIKISLLELNIDDNGRHLEKIKNKLRVEDLEDDELEEYEINSRKKQNLLQQSPIWLKSGRDEKSLKSMIQIDNSRIASDKQRLLISPGDFQSVTTTDGRKRIYGVYEFIVIFLCKNFLSYYRCHWNFMRGVSRNDEMCEYLYDSIVSVKIRERASSNIIDSTLKKRVYSEFISITTKDGKEVEFKIEQGKKLSSNTCYRSPAKSAVKAIRRMLRQRRIDVLRVEQEDSQAYLNDMDWDDE
ncbi:hypothetical protein [Tolypothrix sp. VBCCA 56010]|uniref:hypothetical protein n=1 Tax=Tolypothrix sp. VBCCA 56010 TaxID=3137731 RepID=UPI003D7E3BE5